MSQFSKEPPWVRDKARTSKLGGIAIQQTQLAIPQQTQITIPQPTQIALPQQTQIAIPQQTQIAIPQPTQIAIPQQGFNQPPLVSSAVFALPQPGIALPTSLATSQVTAISYPTPRSSAATAQQPTVQLPSQQQKVSTGVVTKLHDNFGFIDDDIFFQASCVIGNLPQVGDRVVFEASYNPSMPFKWNATRVQTLTVSQVVPVSQPSSAVLQSASSQPAASVVSALAVSFPSVVSLSPAAAAQVGAVYQAAAAAAYQAVAASGLVPNLPQNTPSFIAGQNQATSGSTSRSVNIIGGRRTEGLRDHDRPRVREMRERRSPRKRSRSPVRRRSRSPRRSRSRSRSRSNSTSPQRSRRIGSTQSRYNVHVPKVSLDMKQANVLALRTRYANMYIPSDFYCASLLWADVFPLYRPLELGHSCKFHIMDKSVENPFAEDSNEVVVDPADADYRYSAKVLLLSMSSMDELYRLSCSLAEDPPEVRDSFQHPTRLVQFLVGLRGKNEPMAIGGPWSPLLDGLNPEKEPKVLVNTAVRTTLALTGIDLSRCTQWYTFAEIRYHRQEEIRKGRLLPARVETVVIFLPDVWTCCATRLDWQATVATYRSHLESKLLAASGIEDPSRADTKDDDTAVDKADDVDNEPTHYSELDPKNMQVSSLRQELEARGLSSKGLKSQLIARLVKVLKNEQEKEEGGEIRKVMKEDEGFRMDDKEEERVREEEDKRHVREKQRAILERKYALPEEPHIIVHPSSSAKSGRFDCAVMSLSVLLDYRPEDNKEHSFEVSLFAELFNEMLMRDFGFRIYKALALLPDRTDDDKKKTDDKKKVAEDSEKIVADGAKKDIEMLVTCERKEGDVDVTAAPYRKKTRWSAIGLDDKKNDEANSKNEKSGGKMKVNIEEQEKMFTADPALLLAFVYFDQLHAGYLLDKDVEDILNIIGLNLSRSQVRKLIGKLVSRDQISYRKLTDKPVAKVGVDCQIGGIKVSDVDDKMLAQGNSIHMERAKEVQSDNGNDNVVASDGMVVFNGAIVNVGSIVNNLSSSEKSRVELEAKLKAMENEYTILRADFRSCENNRQKLASEVDELRCQLRHQRRDLDKVDATVKNQFELLTKVSSTLSELARDIDVVIDKPPLLTRVGEKTAATAAVVATTKVPVAAAAKQSLVPIESSSADDK